MFTETDMEMAISCGIFTKKNEVCANPAKVIRFFETWAKIRESAIRHQAAEICLKAESKDSAHKDIMNIRL